MLSRLELLYHLTLDKTMHEPPIFESHNAEHARVSGLDCFRIHVSKGAAYNWESKAAAPGEEYLTTAGPHYYACGSD